MGSTVVELLTSNPKLEGSNTATAALFEQDIVNLVFF